MRKTLTRVFAVMATIALLALGATAANAAASPAHHHPAYCLRWNPNVSVKKQKPVLALCSALGADPIPAAASKYYFENTDTGWYMTPGEPAGTQILMSHSIGEAAEFTRINFYAKNGTGYYEYQDVVTGDCLKVDANIGVNRNPVVEEPCVSGHSSVESQEELISDPPTPSNLYSDDNGRITDDLQNYNNEVWFCYEFPCSDVDWSLPAA